LFRHSPSIAKPFSTLPPRRASNTSFSVWDLLARDRCLFPCIFIISLLVISPVSIGLLLGVMLGPDLWVVDVSIILAFGSRRTSVGLGFLALSVKEYVLALGSQSSVSKNKCWLGVFNPSVKE
jgi:hypothetical protein